MSGSERVQNAFDGIYRKMKSFSNSFRTELPGYDWTPFEHTQGAACRWRKVDFNRGRAVEFASNGPSAMPLHFHSSSEILVCVKGEIAVTVNGRKTILKERQSIVVGAGKVHAAHFTCRGEVTIWWPDLEEDFLDVSILG